VNVVVGVVWYKNDTAERQLWLTSLEAAAKTLLAARPGASVSIHGIDNAGGTGCPSPATLPLVQLPARGNIGFGAGHNVLMAEAFGAGADCYVGVNPDGRFHRHSLARIVEAAASSPGDLFAMRQFPAEHPVPYDPGSGRALWVSGAAFCCSSAGYERVGGFDERFWMFCEDVDLSWRYRYAGRSSIIVADALYYHDTANRTASPAVHSRMMASGYLLARKWGSESFARSCADYLAAHHLPLPETAGEPMPPDARRVATFDYGFSFARPRW
jgi:hypothetical protein